MDVNGTRLHLVLGADDWAAAIVPPRQRDVCFDASRNTLGLRPRPFLFAARPQAPRLVPTDRRGADVDRLGNRFWIGPAGDEIRVLGAGGTAFRYWPVAEQPSAPPPGGFGVCMPPPAAPVCLSGLAVTDDQYLVAGVLGPAQHPAGGDVAGLLVFDLLGGGPPVTTTWPAELAVRPFDLAALPGGGVVVLDVPDPTAPGPARLWQLDRRLRVVDLGGAGAAEPVRSWFEPADGGPSPAPGPRPGTSVDPERATAGCAATLDTVWAVAVDALPDRTVLVLDRHGPGGRMEVSRWRGATRLPFGLRDGGGGPAEPGFSCSDQRGNAPQALAGTAGHDLVAVPGDAADGALATLYVVDDRGDQAFEFRVEDSGADLVPAYHPLRLFGGKALVRTGARAEYDLEDRWFPVPTHVVERFPDAGTVVLAPPLAIGQHVAGRGFDAGTPGTVWHRLVLDAVVPSGCSVTVATRAGDDASVLDGLPWRAEPAPYLRGDGSEVAYHRYPDGNPCPGQGSWELLLQRAVGRYLQVRLTLQGDGRRSPRIWALRLHYPRFSYLERYLPAIYRDDRESASFLDRYLANVEGMYTTLEGRIADVQRLLDPGTTDPEYLPWLASWLGAVVEPDWEPARARLFVRHAARMFTRRGTVRGLREAIRLATHPCPTDALFDPDAPVTGYDVRIVEAYRTRSVPGVVFGDPGDLGGPRVSSPGPRWQLADGRSRLEARWLEFTRLRQPAPGGRSPAGGPRRFPALTPVEPAAARDWTEFVRGQLAVTYAQVGSDADLSAFRAFLEQRYRRVEDYHAAWNLQGAGKPAAFNDVQLPVRLPPDGVPLQDWIVFVSAVLPIRRAAHRCSVLVPVGLADTDEQRARRLGRVQRVVDVDRPAHTLVDVKPYWAALRVGEARVGLESIVGEGGRYVDVVLGGGRLAHAAVPGGATWRADRRVVGRDRIERPARGPAGTGGAP
ncbi:phage tail protein [Geodermatophilus sp. SYSU D00804]